MPSSIELITSNTLSTSAASVTFSSIPSTYTDLVLRVSARSTYASDNFQSMAFYLNGSTSSYSRTVLRADGSAASSIRQSSLTEGRVTNPIGTSFSDTNIFGSLEFYIPNYAGSNNKCLSTFEVMDRNSTTSWIATEAHLWSNTAAITSIKMEPYGGTDSFTSGSSFYLYGIKNS